jgi:phosphohistidine phosphatase
MARQLWLLRHADAEPHGTRPDAERRLTARGELQARVLGAALERMLGEFPRTFVSPKVRAWQTAELAAGQWGPQAAGALAVHAPLAGNFDASQALEALAASVPAERVALVGHEPDLSGVVAALTGARIDLKKGGLAVVRLGAGGAELVLLLRPSELALIARVSDLDV